MKAFLVYMYKTYIILQNRNESVWVYRVDFIKVNNNNKFNYE